MDTFAINGIVIGSYWYDVEHEKMLFYTTLGKLTAEISMSDEQYRSICKTNHTPEDVWNALATLFGDKESKVNEQWFKCPLGGDETDDCADCAYSADYHFVDGECVLRDK